VIVFITSEIGFHKVLVEFFGKVIHSPVESVEVEMNKLLATGYLSHFQLGKFSKGILQVLTEHLLCCSVFHPGIVVTCTKDEGVELFGTSLTGEEVEVEFRRTVS